MRRAPRIVVCTVVALLATTVSGCAARGSGATIYATGRIGDDLVVVAAPTLAAPLPDLEVGFGGGASGAPAPRGRVATITALTSVGGVSRVTSVAISVGDRVEAGDVIATFDDAALRADLVAARATARTAHAQRPVIDAALDTAADGAATIASTRRKLTHAIADLTRTRAELAARRAQIAGVLAHLPALPPGGVIPTPSVIPSGAVPPGGMPNPAALKAALAQLDAGLAKIDVGLAKARAGLAKLSSASAKLSDARAVLADAADLADVAGAAADVGIEAAEYRLSLATVRSPQSGVVIALAQVGDVLAPGATVASIRRDAAWTATTWLAPDVAERIVVGDGAVVSADWPDGQRLNARVTRIELEAQYPPTTQSTREIHLTRAVLVEITGESGSMPAGAPVDIEITPARAAGDGGS